MTLEQQHPAVETDPFLLEVVRGHLVMTCEEMGLAMMRTSLSPIFNEGRDFSCAVFDASGEMVAQGDFCPAHIGAIVHVVEWCVREVAGGEGLVAGDVVLHNDPFRGGCHLPEFMVLRPIFWGDRLVAFAANIAHMPDVGGMVPGAFGDTRSIFQEGLRLPPVKIVREDREVEDLLRVILSNIRGPRYGYGDLKAMIGSLYLAERRVLELVERYGADRFDGFARDIKLVSERMTRAVVERLPDGEWGFEGFIEDDGVSADQQWRIRVTVVVRGDELIVDFTGSSEQSRGPANQTFGATASGAYAAVFNILGDIPFNHGCYRPISIIAPPGSFVNVEYPGSCVGGNTDSMPTTIDVVLGAISELAGKGTAGDGDTYGILTFNGTDPRTGEDFTMVYYDRPGWGGRVDADGNTAMGCKNGNGSSMPVEIVETRYPITVGEYRLNTEADGRPGAGLHRGGFGTVRVLTMDAPEVTVSGHTNRNVVRPWGAAGGGQGGNCTVLFRPAGDTQWHTATQLFNTKSNGKFSNITLHHGDQVMIGLPGGGGYGPPAERDHEAIVLDVRNQLYSPEAAAAEYGIDLREVAGVS